MVSKISRVCCAKNVFAEHGAVPEMKEGPSEPACRSRLQTAVSCFSPKGCGGVVSRRRAGVVLCERWRHRGRLAGGDCHELLRSKAAVVNVMVKRRGCDRVMYGSGRRAQANLR